MAELGRLDLWVVALMAFPCPKHLGALESLAMVQRVTL